jgi:Zn-finger nucleic acid-binding protein
MAAARHRCPACREPLVAGEMEGLEIDYCAACGGTWLDAGELEQIAERAGAAPDALSRALASAGRPRLNERRCPRCAKPLREVAVEKPEGVGPAVRIDRCPRGDGLWFDRGELKTLVARFDEGESGAVARFIGELFRHDLERK